MNIDFEPQIFQVENNEGLAWLQDSQETFNDRERLIKLDSFYPNLNPKNILITGSGNIANSIRVSQQFISYYDKFQSIKVIDLNLKDFKDYKGVQYIQANSIDIIKESKEIDIIYSMYSEFWYICREAYQSHNPRYLLEFFYDLNISLSETGLLIVDASVIEFRDTLSSLQMFKMALEACGLGTIKSNLIFSDLNFDTKIFDSNRNGILCFEKQVTTLPD